jgi:hypothetical protein
MALVATPLPPGTVLVRYHSTPSAPFEWAICVTEEDEGETLVLRGLDLFLPGLPPPPPSVWKEARAELYPHAIRVRFERRTKGRSRWVTLPLKDISDFSRNPPGELP